MYPLAVASGNGVCPLFGTSRQIGIWEKFACHAHGKQKFAVRHETPTVRLCPTELNGSSQTFVKVDFQLKLKIEVLYVQISHRWIGFCTMPIADCSYSTDRLWMFVL